MVITVIILAVIFSAGLYPASPRASTAQAPASLAATSAAVIPAPRLPPAGWPNMRRIRLDGPYPAELLHVVDGDTFVARVPVWLGQDIITHVRLRGIDTPELNGRCAAEMRLARDARQALIDILKSGRIALRDIGTGKYAGRVIARVYVTASHDAMTEEAGAMLLAAGYARTYRGGKRNGWCKEGLAGRQTP